MSIATTPIEDVRVFWNRLPCNLLDSSQPVGTRAYFDELEAKKYALEPDIPRFAAFPRWRGRKVLEIGCGLGTDSVNFARAGAALTAIDLSDRSLQLCQQRFQVYGLSARFFQANAEELSRTVPVEPYDLVYSFGVLHHTPNPARAFAELRQYLGPQSELRIMLYSKWSWKTLGVVVRNGRGAFWRMPELMRIYAEAQKHSPVTYCYSMAEIRRLLAGYRILDIHKEHFYSQRLFSYRNGQCDRLVWCRWMPSAAFRWIERTLGWHTLVIARRAD